MFKEQVTLTFNLKVLREGVLIHIFCPQFKLTSNEMNCFCFSCFVAFDSLEGGRGKGFKEAKPDVTQKIQYLVGLVFCTFQKTTCPKC